MTSSSSSGDVFSFDTPEAVLRVLASIRASEATIAQKNELRDLVLSYTNGGKDPSVQIQISQRLQSLGVTPSAMPVAASVPAPVPHEFGSARSVPSFTPSKAAQVSTAPTPIVAPAPTPAPVSVAATPIVEPAPAPVAPDTQTTVIPIVTQQQPAPAPTPTSTPTPAAVAPSADNNEALVRIREIKSLVNEKVGNPVNLVDINNAVGREYMSALLDAMKQLNTGAAAETAMARLEAAFVSVQQVLESHEAPAPAPTSTPVAPQSEPVPVPEAATAAPVVATTPATPAPAATEDVSASSARWATPQVPAAPVAPPVTAPASTPAPVDSPVAAPSAPSPVKSLAESAAPLKSLNDVPTAASVNSSATGDPLFTKEVSNGLNQLLSDWILFKKSGLFGTGPKGVEHPLYIKIKDLQVPLLLAGRFEGATQEIKQSVTDYMNGWRYEQGIIYTPGETFDHYLRRVIRHILDLQK